MVEATAARSAPASSSEHLPAEAWWPPAPKLSLLRPHHGMGLPQGFHSSHCCPSSPGVLCVPPWPPGMAAALSFLAVPCPEQAQDPEQAPCQILAPLSDHMSCPWSWAGPSCWPLQLLSQEPRFCWRHKRRAPTRCPHTWTPTTGMQESRECTGPSGEGPSHQMEGLDQMEAKSPTPFSTLTRTCHHPLRGPEASYGE